MISIYNRPDVHFVLRNSRVGFAMNKCIEKAYQPAGFILLGALAGSGLTLAVQGKLSTPDMVDGMLCLFGLLIFVANGRRNKATYFLGICLLGAGNAVGFAMRGKVLGAIVFTVFASIYAGSAWFEDGKQRKKRAEEIAQSV